MLWEHYPKVFNTTPLTMDIVSLVGSLLETFSLAVSLKITTTVLEEMGLDKAAAELRHLCFKSGYFLIYLYTL